MWYAPHVGDEDRAVAVSCVKVYNLAPAIAAWASFCSTVVDEGGDELYFLLQSGVRRTGYQFAILSKQEVER